MHKEIIDRIKKGDISPVYLLGGDEPYFIDQVTHYIEKNLVEEGSSAFNLDIFYGLEVQPEKVKAICREFPMMAERRVVVIKEAQKVTKIDAFDEYILHPSPTTVLVIALKGKTFDQRKKAYSSKHNPHITLLNAKKIPDYKLASWIKTYLEGLGYAIDVSQAQLLADHLGSDLNKIVSEIEKLIIGLEKGKRISPKDIQDNIGISKDFNIFELQKALATCDYLKANRIILYFIANPKTHPAPVTLASLNSYFTRLMILYYSKDKSDKGLAVAMGIQPFFLREYKEAAQHYKPKKVLEILSLIRNYDVQSKGFKSGYTTNTSWQKELIYKIMH